MHLGYAEIGRRLGISSEHVRQIAYTNKATSNLEMVNTDRGNLGRIIKQQRAMRGLTLGELGVKSGVSPSHLGRIERGERYPSARVLRRLAKPLGFEESELFTLANYLSPQTPLSENQREHNVGRLDPYVAGIIVTRAHRGATRRRWNPEHLKEYCKCDW